MAPTKKRVITGIVGLVLSLSLVACEGDDDPSATTPAGDSETTAPLGS